MELIGTQTELRKWLCAKRTQTPRIRRILELTIINSMGSARRERIWIGGRSPDVAGYVS